jgi:hypothetical protein
MTTKVGVNGFGRIGHAFTRLALERTDLEVVNPVKPHHDSLAGCWHHGPFGIMNVIFGLALASAACGPADSLTMHRQREGSAGGTGCWEPPGVSSASAA